jgi:hypothetical protein
LDDSRSQPPRLSLRAVSAARGAKVRVHTGGAADTPGTVHCDLSYYVWNNGGDLATLKNRSGRRIDRCKYSGAGSHTRCRG